MSRARSRRRGYTPNHFQYGRSPAEVQGTRLTHVYTSTELFTIIAPFVRGFEENMNRLIADAQLFQYLIVFFGLFSLSLGLYEDQVGKFDW